MSAFIIRIFIATCLVLPTCAIAQTNQEARLQAYQDYWQPLAKRRFDRIVELKIDALRNRAIAHNIAFPDALKIRTIKGPGSPISYLSRDLMLVPEEYLFQVIGRSETLAIVEPIFLATLPDMLATALDGQPEYGLLPCYFELLLQYDSVLGAQEFLHCTTAQRQKIAQIRAESLKADRDDYFSNVYTLFDEAVEMMLAHEAAHFALDHIVPEDKAVAHAQEYAADRHAKSLLDLMDIAGGSVPLLVLALGQPGLLTAESDTKMALAKAGFSTHPSPQCRAAHLIQQSGGIAEMFAFLLDEGDELQMPAFVPLMKMAVASLPDINEIIDELECDTPD